MSKQSEHVDVAICGAGLAGLALARQLKLQMPHLHILLLDRLERPLPTACFKVGESTSELGAYYLKEMLGLENYLEQSHLRKLGLRMFFDKSGSQGSSKAELGLSEFIPPHSYNIDRGVLENDLREMIVEEGVSLREGAHLREIAISQERNSPHIIHYTCNDERGTVKARWVIDATGRRRWLQKNLGISKPNNTRFSSVWFRVEARIDVDDFVNLGDPRWKEHVAKGKRYLSTNHLCGLGYWVWLIPLSSGYTSIGIVADGNVHSFDTFSNEDKACSWIQEYESELAHALASHTFADFCKMPFYSYDASQVFSDQRWACIGEAGVFADPLFSPGTDLIGIANTLTCHLIELDQSSELSPDRVAQLNQFYLSYSRGLCASIQNSYTCFKHAMSASLKIIWDTLASWCFSVSLLFSSTCLLDNLQRGKLRQGSGEFLLLGQRMQRLFKEWAQNSKGQISFDFLDLSQLDFYRAARARNLSTKTADELISDSQENLKLLEDFALVIFKLAIIDLHPEKQALLDEHGWLNAWAISLNPDKWENEGLFRPHTPARDLGYIEAALLKCIKVSE